MGVSTFGKGINVSFSLFFCRNEFRLKLMLVQGRHHNAVCSRPWFLELYSYSYIFACRRIYNWRMRSRNYDTEFANATSVTRGKKNRGNSSALIFLPFRWKSKASTVHFLFFHFVAAGIIVPLLPGRFLPGQLFFMCLYGKHGKDRGSLESCANWEWCIEFEMSRNWTSMNLRDCFIVLLGPPAHDDAASGTRPVLTGYCVDWTGVL